MTAFTARPTSVYLLKRRAAVGMLKASAGPQNAVMAADLMPLRCPSGLACSAPLRPPMAQERHSVASTVVELHAQRRGC